MLSLLLFPGVSVFAETFEYETVIVARKSKSKAASLEKIQSEVVLQETVPHFSQPVLGGLMGDRILLTLDGIKFSNAMFRDGPNQYYSWIPAEFVESASLNDRLGGISSGALGGSVNRVLGIRQSSIGLNYDGGDRGFKESISYRGAQTSIGFLNEKTGNVITPNGEVDHSSYNQQGLFVGHNSENYGDTRLLVSHSGPIDRTDKFTEGKFYQYDQQDYALVSHKYRLRGANLVIYPSYQQIREVIDQNSPTKNNTDVTNKITGLQVVGFYQPDPESPAYFQYGVVENLEALNYLTGLVKTDYKYDTGSLWGTYSDSWGESFDYSVKYKYSTMSAVGSGLNRKLDNHSVGLDAEYALNAEQSVFASLDSGYKFPTITNLAEVKNDALSEIANADLNQERAVTVQIGYDWQKVFRLSVFHKKLSDLIVRKQTDIPDGAGRFKWKYSMADEGAISGINLKYDQKIEKNTVFLFLEYLNGRNDYDNFSKLTPFHAKAKWSYELATLADDQLALEYLYAPPVPPELVSLSDSQDVRIKEHNVGYKIFNLSYESLYLKTHHLKLSFNNLFNQTGRVYGSSVDFAGRSLQFSYAYQF